MVQRAARLNSRPAPLERLGPRLTKPLGNTPFSSEQCGFVGHAHSLRNVKCLNAALFIDNRSQINRMGLRTLLRLEIRNLVVLDEVPLQSEEPLLKKQHRI